MSKDTAEGQITDSIDERIANMDESIALPRANGELLFAAPGRRAPLGWLLR